MPGGKVKACGNGALAGKNKHGSAIICTPGFGGPFRAAAGVGALLLPTEKCNACGATLGLALKRRPGPSSRTRHRTLPSRSGYWMLRRPARLSSRARVPAKDTRTRA